LKSALECRAAALGLLPDGVCFTGQRADVPALLDGSGVFVLTSDHEGFPNVLLEAMAARLPVVTTPAGDAADLVEDGRTGFVVDFGDKKKLVERIERLTDSPDLRRELGEAGRKRVEEVYGCAGVASRLLGIYRKVALERGKRHLASRIETLADSEDALGGVGTRGLEK
jgi:glycosyltransferase involved in cell wall biosynthesis